MSKDDVIVMKRDANGIFVPSHTEKRNTKLKKMVIRKHMRRNPIDEVLEGFDIGLDYAERFSRVLRRL